MNNEEEIFINRKQASRRTGFSPKSYSTWDSRKTYDLKPQIRKGVIVYRQSIIDAHAESRRLIRQA